MSIWDGDYGELDVRRVQPYDATKLYVCPGCNRDILTGLGHYVVIPQSSPDLRRHWHYACWDHRPAHSNRF
jgi:hypothetical protein